MQTVLKIVSAQPMVSQEELLCEIHKAGFNCTQATLSRDLRQLHISKVQVHKGHSVYALHGDSKNVPRPTGGDDNARWRVQFSGNLMVINTPPGHAGMVAYDIDSVGHPFFLGTIAGDDTVFVAMGENVTHENARRAIDSIIPRLAQT